MAENVGNKVKKRIYAHGREWVFTPKRFLSLGSRQAIDLALLGKTKEGAPGTVFTPSDFVTLGEFVALIN